MNARQLLGAIEADIQKAPDGVVLYLEGKTDPEVLFALLGRPSPTGGLAGGAYVVGLPHRGGGGSMVEARVQVAREAGIGGVYGVVDGDGRSLDALAARFDAPFAGPLFSWKGYCIENLLAQAAWPTAWGPAPDWALVLDAYVPYAALNRVHREVRGMLERLGLHRFRRPETGSALETDATVKAALGEEKGAIAGFDAEAAFDRAAQVIRQDVGRSIEAGHTHVDGKWLVRDFAVRRVGASAEACRRAWVEAVRDAGGLPAVRAWWDRVVDAGG